MGESKKTINQISSTTKASILRKTAYGLPLRPSESGMSAEDIKKAFYAGITDKEDSIMAELERVISEANTVLQNLKETVDGQIDKKVDNVDGKGLSTNDFTNELKTKLENPDDVPTAGSNNLITSKGVHDYPAVAFAETERRKSKNLCGLVDFEQTVNGVTIKFVSSSQTVILNGTATSAFDAMQTVRNMLPYVSHMQGEDLKVTAYYVSGTKSDSAIAFISTVDNNDVFGDRSAGISLPDNNITSINFSPSKNSTYNTLMLYATSGASFTNYAFRIQIEKDRVTDWEYPCGAVLHNKELDDISVSNSAFSLSEANANSYQSVYDLLRFNKGVGNFYFNGADFPSFLPPCPEDVWHGTGNINQIVVKIDTNNFTKSMSMTLQGINQNTPAYKLNVYFDGTYWRNDGWHRPSKPNSSVSDFATSPASTTLYPSFKLIDDIHRGSCNYNSGIFSSLNAFVEWVQNSAPTGFYNMLVNIEGGVSGYLVMKANSSYASIAQISYFRDVGLRINFLENGVWTGWKTATLT